MRAPHWLRRMLRPLVPDRWMARRRIRDHSVDARHNVDIVVADRKRARLWLDTTPDTFRVRAADDFGDGPPLRQVAIGTTDVDPAEVVLLAGSEVSETLAATLGAPLSDSDLAAVVLGEVAPPRLVARHRVEPSPVPTALAVRGAAWLEVNGAPAGNRPLPGLLERLRDAGHHLALVPAARAGSPWRRGDPVTGTAAVVFSLVPLHDLGGGSRSAQMAFALLRAGWHVTFVACQPSRSTDLGLRYIHPRLEQRTVAEFDPVAYVDRLEEPALLAIAGVPIPAVAEHASALRAGGALVVYDCIDDWSSPWLGGIWYEEQAERSLIGTADTVVAAAPDLVGRLAETFGSEAHLVPNGVDAHRFGTGIGAPPADLPAGNQILGYHGTLRADWLDWQAITELAAARPDAALVLIGDPPDPKPTLPGNVHFLGLKPHGALPRYVGRFDVGLLPFVPDPATHAASPLKVYEYLAAGVPVAAPPLRSLDGLSGVFTDLDIATAVTAALEGPTPDADRARRDHAWEARVAHLFRVVGLPDPAFVGPAALVVERPAIHYPKGRRRG